MFNYMDLIIQFHFIFPQVLCFPFYSILIVNLNLKFIWNHEM